jgi:hypothetical protein
MSQYQEQKVLCCQVNEEIESDLKIAFVENKNVENSSIESETSIFSVFIIRLPNKRKNIFYHEFYTRR